MRRWLVIGAVGCLLLGAARGPAAAACLGDCDGNGSVTAAELTKAVAIVLDCGGTATGCASVPGGCANAAQNDGTIDVGDLVAIVNDIIELPTGCPAASSPANTATSAPAATATPTVPTAPAPTDTGTPTDTPSPLPTATPTTPPPPTATETPTPTDTPAAAALGDRTFTLTRNSGFYSSFLPLSSVGTSSGTFTLHAGAPDAGGHATVTVTGPAYITTPLQAGGTTLCVKIESCTGDLYCNGGVNVNATETLDSLKAGLTCTQDGSQNCPSSPTNTCCSNACEASSGGSSCSSSGSSGSGNSMMGAFGVNPGDSGAGALILTCTQRSVAPCETSGVDCTKQDYSTATDTQQLYTTGNNTAVVTNHCAGKLSGNNAKTIPTFTKAGQNFSCSEWTTSNGPGKLAFSIPTEQPTTLFAGDGAQAGLYAGD